MNRYVDIHAILLPDMRTGEAVVDAEARAKSSLEHLQAQCKAIVVAPYYDHRVADLDAFLQLRDAQIAKLQAYAAAFVPKPVLVAGATVSLAAEYPEYGQLQRLAIGQTNYLLLAIPKQRPSLALYERLEHVQIAGRMTPILANADEYFDCMTLQDWYDLREAGVLLQISSTGILQQKTRNLSLYLLNNQLAQFVASGHAGEDAAERFVKAMGLVKRSIPLEQYKRLKSNPGMLLSNPQPTAFL